MRRTALRVALWLSCGVGGLLAGERALFAQTAVTNSPVNLRRDPSTRRARIAVLRQGAKLVLLSPDTTRGFLHVRTPSGGRRGWVWSAAVDVESPDGEPTPTPMPAPAPPPTPSPGPGPSPSPPPRPSPGDSALTPAPTAPASYNDCPIEGDPSPNGPRYAELVALNQRKNRYTAPDPAAIDPSVTLQRMLAPGDDRTRFDESRGAVIEGYVVDAKVGGIETVNCRTTDPPHRDTHIEIALAPGAPPTERVIVEVTPRWREQLLARGTDWSTPGLQAALTGKRVRFRGWLLYDKEHEQQAEHTNPGAPGNWRATVWELHPVTGIEVLTAR